MKQKLLRHIILLLLMLVALMGFSQQDPMFTQYMNNPQLINPAYAGSHGNFNVNGISRQQWVGAGIDWAPKTTSISINSPFLDYRVGIGMDFMNDKIGPMTQTALFTNYAYQIEFKNGATLALGLKAGFNFFEKDLSGLITTEYDRYVAEHTVVNKLLFNTGVGAYYFNERYFVGMSVPKLIRNSFSEVDNTFEINSRQEMHLFMTAGYVFDLNTVFKLKPTAMLRMVDGAPVSYEFTATAIFVDKVWFGLMYRWGDAVAAHVRAEIKDGVQIGYSYDLTTSELNQFNSGTHEIFISYTIVKKGKRILSPRYF